MSWIDWHAVCLVSDDKVVQFKSLEQRRKEALERCADNFSAWATKVATDGISEKIVWPEPKKIVGASFDISTKYATRKNPSGRVPSLENTILALAHLGIKPRYDVFHNKIVLEGHPNLDDYEFESACLVIRHLISYRLRFEPSKETIYDAVDRIAHAYRFNPV